MRKKSPTQSPTSATESTPFFVGYLPMPVALKKFYWPVALIFVVFFGIAAYYIAAQQKSNATALWHTTAPITMQGVLTLNPYPTLHRLDQQSDEIESILLVSRGKHSATVSAAGFDHQAVSVEGYLIHRGGWTMLEISAADSIQSSNVINPADLTARLAIKPIGEIFLNGEIADSKCLLGVMKPGAGKIHKACAEVCLLGGIPPLLVARDANQKRYAYLLARSDGSSASKLLAALAAETVRISGQLQRQGALLYIAMDEDGIQPTTPISLN